jgi:hypothetical protein
VPIAVGTIYLGAIGIGILTYVVSGTDPRSAWVLTTMIGATLTAVGGYLLTVPVYTGAPANHRSPDTVSRDD